ncbi:MAG: polyphosphate polymerase domain-containing protein [Bacteroidota bacterium]
MSELLKNILAQFPSISLDEMDAVSLMDRVDTKYVFSLNALSDILSDAVHHYRILEINQVRQHLYDSLYYDTNDFQMYYWHHNKRLNRYKIRFRKYVNSNGLTFLEIKFKDNKEKTYKKRKKHQDIESQIPSALQNFIQQQTPFTSETLHPTLQIQYYRLTLVNNDWSERVTIDTNLSFNNFHHNVSLENIAIAEVKRSSYASHTAFLKLIKQHHIREGGLSKYCTGIALTNSNIKKNNFLPFLRILEKIK